MDVILEIMYRLPAATYLLVLFMSLVGALLINYMLDANILTTIIAVPSLLFAGLFGNALLRNYGVLLSPDKASNAALSASLGFVLLALLIFVKLRIWYKLQDKR